MKASALMDTERPSASPDEPTTRPVGYPQIRPSPRRCSLPELVLIAAVAAGGAFGLVRLAYHVTSAPPQTHDGLILQQYAQSIWLHPVFLELARRPSELAECQSCESYRRFADAHRLQNAWYLLTIEGVQINGEIVRLPFIRKPYEMSEHYFAEFLGVLAVGDGKRPAEVASCIWRRQKSMWFRPTFWTRNLAPWLTNFADWTPHRRRKLIEMSSADIDVNRRRCTPGRS